MKRTLIIFSMLLICYFSISTPNYEIIVEQQAQIWKSNYINTLTNPNHLQTIIDVILLSYQLATESCNMAIAKLTLQEELLKIYTPSLIDSWQTNMQVMQNDTSKIQDSLNKMNACQQRFGFIFDQLKLVAPRLIQINPQPTQTLISDLKEGLLIWTKEQQEIADQFEEMQTEFTAAIATISDVTNLFEITLHATHLKKTHLKEAAGCVSRSYKDIEAVFGHFTKIRKTSLHKMQQFFSCFFKTYYTAIYELIPESQLSCYKTMAQDGQDLPLPDNFFATPATL